MEWYQITAFIVAIFFHMSQMTALDKRIKTLEEKLGVQS